jgi:hypothetical protein
MPGVIAPRKAWRLLQGESPCRVRVATHPYRVLRPWRSRESGEQDGRSVDRASWRPQGEPRPLKCWYSFEKACCGRRGFSRSRRPHAPIRHGEEGQVRRSPQAVACRKRDVEARGRPQTFLPWKTTVYGLQLLRHGRGNLDTEQGWNLRPVGEHVTGRWRSPVTGKAHHMRFGESYRASYSAVGKAHHMGKVSTAARSPERTLIPDMSDQSSMSQPPCGP